MSIVVLIYKAGWIYSRARQSLNQVHCVNSYIQHKYYIESIEAVNVGCRNLLSAINSLVLNFVWP